MNMFWVSDLGWWSTLGKPLSKSKSDPSGHVFGNKLGYGGFVAGQNALRLNHSGALLVLILPCLATVINFRNGLCLLRCVVLLGVSRPLHCLTLRVYLTFIHDPFSSHAHIAIIVNKLRPCQKKNQNSNPYETYLFF